MLGEAAGGVYGNMWWPPSPTVCCIHTQGGGDTTIDTQGVIMVSLEPFDLPLFYMMIEVI